MSIFGRIFGPPVPVPPPEPVFQTSHGIVPIISSRCADNEEVNYVHYKTIEEAHLNYYLDTINLQSSAPEILKPYWDSRYTNNISPILSPKDYENYTGLDTKSGVENISIGTLAARGDSSGSVIQSECINGVITAGTIINLWDAPEQELLYSGPQSTFVYSLTQGTKPWNITNGNLMIQANFDKPIYTNYENNHGGGVNFGCFLYNKKLKKNLNFVIGVYAFGNGVTDEVQDMQFDPTTNVVHIGTVIKDGTRYSTKSPYSKSIQKISSQAITTTDDNKWENFYRVNISHQNLYAVLKKINKVDYGFSPSDWELSSIMIQYELEESGGKAILAGSFRGFEVYSSELPL